MTRYRIIYTIYKTLYSLKVCVHKHHRDMIQEYIQHDMVEAAKKIQIVKNFVVEILKSTILG